MKRHWKVAGALGALALFAGSASAQIVGSAHDFTVLSGPNANYAFQTRTSNVCGTCHAAHNAIATDAPLWVHTLSTATYTLYSSATMNAVPQQPVGVSRACLSCHDGTVAVNSVRGVIATGGTVTGPVLITGGDGLIGTNIADDHPISITYNETADPGLRAKSLVGAEKFPLYGPGKDQVECGSCHDPHLPGASGLFFRSYNTTTYRSRCQVCHIK